ncbi:flagellar hook protein FlgE [Xanthobacteraceae bacterium A53D]
MSLYGTLRTSVSGMNAQSNKLGAISENIANSSTIGYKKASTDFSSLIVDSSTSEYNSGSVNTKISYDISTQGTKQNTTSATDLMVSGDGFFLVDDGSGQTVLTRAGSFTINAATGNLENTAGFTLLAYDIRNGQDPATVVNGTGGLVPVNLGSLSLAAVPTTSGSITANLPSNSEAVAAAANTPGDNAADSVFTKKSSISTYDNLGNEVILDVYYTKVGDGTAPNTGEWEVAVYNQADSTNGGFPYGAAGSASLYEGTMVFGATGQLVSVTPPASAGTNTIGFTVPGGAAVTVDIGSVTQLANDYSMRAPMNGSAPSAASDVRVNNDGTVYAVDGSGNTINLFKIPLATVQSPDNLTPVAGNAYQVNLNSGALQVGFAGDPGFGSVNSNALENSTVDMASELTEMIIAQRDYTANSKVFQTGTELLDVLMTLKR